MKQEKVDQLKEINPKMIQVKGLVERSFNEPTQSNIYAALEACQALKDQTSDIQGANNPHYYLTGAISVLETLLKSLNDVKKAADYMEEYINNGRLVLGMVEVHGA